MHNDLDFIELLHHEVKPALGCTEPMAIALAVAKCCEELRARGDKVTSMRVNVSRNILKNAMGVGIPGTDMVGLQVAVAVAMACGRSELGLEVLRDVTEEAVQKAREIIENKIIEVDLASSPKMLYIEVIGQSENNRCRVVIEDAHDNISVVEFGDAIQLCNAETTTAEEKRPVHKEEFKPSVREIYNFATTVEVDKIKFILEAAHLNKTIAQEGLSGNYGLQVGKTIHSRMGDDVFGDGLLAYSMALTAAASDARMAGSKMTVMSNSGSGNQGITATLPVVAAAEKYSASEEELCRALVLSHLVAIHIKQNLGRLSALCGCVVASTGSACGIVLLRGGGYVQVASAIKNMVGNITGMVCDGAKVGCALKVASGVSAAVQSAVLALGGISTSHNDGIIDDDLEQTLRNLSAIGCEGMVYTDKLMLEIMVNKRC